MTTTPSPPENPLAEALRGLFGPLLELLKGWPPLLAFGGVTMLLVVVLALLGAVVPDNLVPLLYLAFALTESAFVWLLWDERRRARPSTEQAQELTESEMQKDTSSPTTQPGSQTVNGPQTNIGQSTGPVLSGVFHEQVTIGASPPAESQAGSAAPPSAETGELERLWQVLHTRFDQEELATLCFKLGLHSDDLRGESHSAQARELVLYMNRRVGGLERLRAAMRAERPGVL